MIVVLAQDWYELVSPDWFKWVQNVRNYSGTWCPLILLCQLWCQHCGIRLVDPISVWFVWWSLRILLGLWHHKSVNEQATSTMLCAREPAPKMIVCSIPDILWFARIGISTWCGLKSHFCWSSSVIRGLNCLLPRRYQIVAPNYQRKLGSNTSVLRTNRILRLEMMQGGRSHNNTWHNNT